MQAREGEPAKAFAFAFLIRDMADRTWQSTGPDELKPHDEEAKAAQQDRRDHLLSKLTFMYHYVMNFRSRYTRELKTNVRRKVITAEEHEHGNSQIASISFALKESKQVLDKHRI